MFHERLQLSWLFHLQILKNCFRFLDTGRRSRNNKSFLSFSNILISFRNIFLERIFDYFGYKCLKLHKERIKYWHWYLVTSKWCSFDVFDVIFILTIYLKELSPADNICFKVNCFFFGKWSMLFQTTILFPLSIFSYIPIVVWNRAQYCL